MLTKWIYCAIPTPVNDDDLDFILNFYQPSTRYLNVCMNFGVDVYVDDCFYVSARLNRVNLDVFMTIS